MGQYIKKSTLLAEIDRLVNNYDKALDYEAALEDVRDFIDSLEVKEVDLEKETKKWWKERLHLNPENQLWMDAHQSIVFAKHFYSLGLKAQKGEEL